MQESKQEVTKVKHMENLLCVTNSLEIYCYVSCVVSLLFVSVPKIPVTQII